VEQMLAQRTPVYRECAHKVLDGTRSTEQLAEEVLSEHDSARSTDM
jgi:shikimate kinase